MNESEGCQQINELLSGLRNERSLVQGRLVSDYLPRLTALASQWMRGLPSASEEEEDIALSTLKSFMLRVQDGVAYDLKSPDALWAFLAAMARNKALKRLRAEHAAKRGSGSVFNEADVLNSDANQSPLEMAGPGIGHEDIDLACVELLDQLPNDQFRQIALLLFQGHTQQEVAALLDGKSLSAIQRKVAHIRRLWQNHLNQLN